MTILRSTLSLMLLLTGLSVLAQEIPVIDWEELDKTSPWKATEQWEPVPQKVTPGFFTTPPSDAIILFDGRDLSQWHNPKYPYGVRMDHVKGILAAKAKDTEVFPPTWTVKDGTIIVKPGTGHLETNQAFGDVQLHIEWLAPVDEGKKDQGYSNSGVFFMGLYEVQILNSYENKTYPNGQAGSLYKQHIPLVNASRPPGEWQSYDIVFDAPEFHDDGQLKAPAYITVFHNGVLIQNHVELKGPCIYIGEPSYTQHPAKLPLLLQDHGNLVRYRNIWLREL